MIRRYKKQEITVERDMNAASLPMPFYYLYQMRNESLELISREVKSHEVRHAQRSCLYCTRDTS